MDALAVLILVATGLWGAYLYPQLPEAVATHWNASGEPDAFGAKGLWSVFGSLVVGALMVGAFLVMGYFLARSTALVPSERRTYGLVIGYVNLSLALLFGAASLASWHDAQLGPWFIAFALMAGVPVLAILGLNMPAMTEERRRATGSKEPSLDPRYWVLGGVFYRNPDDPRAFVPRPPHAGLGWTANLATTGGRLMMIAILVLMVGTLALPFLL